MTLVHVLWPSIVLTHKGLTHTQPLSCGFDSSVERALHRYHRGCGFESHSKPEFFSGLSFSSVTAAFAFDISIYSIATDGHQLQCLIVIGSLCSYLPRK